MYGLACVRGGFVYIYIYTYIHVGTCGLCCGFTEDYGCLMGFICRGEGVFLVVFIVRGVRGCVVVDVSW